ESGLLGSQDMVLLGLLVLSLLSDVAEVHGEGVGGRVEQAGLGRVAVRGRAAILRSLPHRRTDGLVARRLRLRLLPGRVAAAILSKVHLELPVFLLASDGLDSLDGV